MVWSTKATDDALIAWRRDLVSYPKIIEYMKRDFGLTVTDAQLARRARFLNVPLTQDQNNRRLIQAVRSAPLKPPPIIKPPTPVVLKERPISHVSGHREMPFNSRLPNIKGIVVLHRPGECMWPLSCDRARVTRWCAEHDALLKNRKAA